jgi:hypothetical protein
MARRRGTRGIFVQYDEETGYGGREFMAVFGKQPMTRVSPTGGGTSLGSSAGNSGGTIQITTGLSDVYHFSWVLENTGSSTPGATYIKHLCINWQKGYIDNGGVTLSIWSGVTGGQSVFTDMVPGSRDWSGVTINWIAIGKERRT